MSYLDQIKACNDFSEKSYLPFIVDGIQIGWTRRNFIKHIEEFDSVFVVDDQSLRFISELNTAALRTEAIAPILKILNDQGIIDSWVGETYAISNTFGAEPFFLMERAAVAYFGTRSYGVHINGLVQKADGVYIWVARRTKSKPFWPGKLDQMVAGGQPAGIGLMENVIKESAEEAAVPQELAEQAKFVGELHYRGKHTLGKSLKASVNEYLGINSDTLFNYDLWLPDDFVPHNTDGEVDEFMLMSLEEMARITDTSDEFKNNCNLVNIDLLLRQGIIDEAHPDYNEIKQCLYVPAKMK